METRTAKAVNRAMEIMTSPDRHCVA